MNGWIAVDLDGTLAEYHGWVNTFNIGAPIPVMAERVRSWIADGKDVRIFTARVDGGLVGEAMGVDAETVATLQRHCRYHGNDPELDGAACRKASSCYL